MVERMAKPRSIHHDRSPVVRHDEKDGPKPIGYLASEVRILAGPAAIRGPVPVGIPRPSALVDTRLLVAGRTPAVITSNDHLRWAQTYARYLMPQSDWGRTRKR
ncbi:hypothetical protein JMUB6875_52970 [Nocardia sp. JMUB6875]